MGFLFYLMLPDAVDYGVAVFADYSGTFKNPFRYETNPGKSFKYRDVDLLTFNDADRITEHRSVQSGKTMMDMVGAKMPK